MFILLPETAVHLICKHLTWILGLSFLDIRESQVVREEKEKIDGYIYIKIYIWIDG